MRFDEPDGAGRRNLPSRPADALLDRARSALSDAELAATPEDRFCLAHLGALRTAAAVVAVYERGARRRRLVNVWVRLDTLAPALGDWSAYFAAGARTRAAIEAGARHALTQQTADDQLRAARAFCRLVEARLGQLPLARAS